jgi:hypothetical protein
MRTEVKEKQDDSGQLIDLYHPRRQNQYGVVKEGNSEVPVESPNETSRKYVSGQGGRQCGEQRCKAADRARR